MYGEGLDPVSGSEPVDSMISGLKIGVGSPSIQESLSRQLHRSTILSLIIKSLSNNTTPPPTSHSEPSYPLPILCRWQNRTVFVMRILINHWLSG